MPRKTIQNDITSAELLAQVNKQNMELLNDFLDYLRSVQRSETTIAAYKNDIEIAWVWCLKNNNNKFFVEWTKRNIVAFQNWLLTENHNSPARIRREKASLSSLSNYIEAVLDDEFPNFRNIINKVESPANQPTRDKTVWEDEELDELLNKLTEKGEYEKACVVALARFSGRRKAELCRFKVSDFSDENLVCEGALYKSAPIKTKGRGGGKFISCYTLAKKFKPYLDAWMAQREKDGIESEWLFPSADNQEKQLSKSTLDSWAKSFSKLTGRDFYFHSLRHAFTTALARSGIPDSVIAMVIGWESVDMVSIYTDMSAEEQFGKYFSGGDINVKGPTSLNELLSLIHI